MTDTPIRDIAMHFEAVKMSMSQDKNGITLRLSVHPNDCPKELHTDWVGSRYMVAMVRLRDDETADDRGMGEINRLISSAGMLCRNDAFHLFLVEHGYIIDSGAMSAEDMANECIEAVRLHCGVESRSEFKENEAARKAFEQLRGEFIAWKQGQP